MLIYDCEIKKAILKKGEQPIEGIEYCGGWRDFENMGIAVIGVYDYTTDLYYVFMKKTFPEFQEMVDNSEIVIGFNSVAFDNALCAVHGLNVPKDKTYDLLLEIWKGAGVANAKNFKMKAGYSLDACADANFGLKKSGWGGAAPVDWQRGLISKVINYCLRDVWLTKKLIDLIRKNGRIQNPKMSGVINVRRPGADDK